MVLLTGGSGYIGSHTAVELINAGYDVVIADDLSNSKADVVDRIAQICKKRPIFYEINVANREQLNRLFEENHIETVIHFAGYKSVGESVAEPLKYYVNNLETTLSLLEIMKKYGVKQFIFSSSATVYGKPLEVPIKETAPTGNCYNPYGVTKYFIEKILTDIANADANMSVVLLRYFNPIGAHESGLIGELPQGTPNNLMPYITQTASGKYSHLNVFGNDYPTPDGTGIRDYIHVVDLAKGHVAALEYANTHKGTEIFNLGTGIGYSVLEIVRAFEKATGIVIPLQFVARRPGDIAECYASPEKANMILKWKAERKIEDMCRDSWRWQQNCDRSIWKR